MNKILLSICIPTNGRIEIVKKTLDSIFFQVKDFSEFEVILSDNSKTDELPELLNQYQNIPNIVYQKTDATGFMNSINALKIGNGELLKLHNNYTELKKGSLDILLKTIKKNQIAKPILFFSNRSLKHISLEEYKNFNDFIYVLSYFSSWSTGFSIWNSDFQKCFNINYNEMFPHTSLLFEQNRKDLYIINNEELFINQKVSKKGGYNLFKTFAIDYLDMLNVCLRNKQISENTFKHIKRDMFKKFLVEWYCNTIILKNDYTFILSDIKQSMNVHYSNSSYYTLILFAYNKAFIHVLKNFVCKTFNMQKRGLT